jgi:hypothetical protein
MARQALIAEGYSFFTGSQIVIGDSVTRSNEPTAEDCNDGCGGDGGGGGITINHGSVKNMIGFFLNKEKQKNETENISIFSLANITIKEIRCVMCIHSSLLIVHECINFFPFIYFFFINLKFCLFMITKRTRNMIVAIDYF